MAKNKKKAAPIPLEWTEARVKLGDLDDWEQNPVKITEEAALELAKSLRKFGQDHRYVLRAPIVKGKPALLMDGHQRKKVEIKYNNKPLTDLVPVLVPNRPLTDAEVQEWVIRHRKNTGEFDFDVLQEFFAGPDLIEWGFDEDELIAGGFDFMGEGGEGEGGADEQRKSLAERFGVPPFSVLDARQGYWQDRKSAWIALGIESELGRGETASTSARADDPSYREIKSRKPNATPGGSPLPAASVGKDGKIVRGDGKGRAMAKAYKATGGPGELIGEFRANENGNLGDNPQNDKGGDGIQSKKGKYDRKKKDTGLLGFSEQALSHYKGDTKAIKTQSWVESVKGEDFTGLGAQQTGTSIFDPVLCELAYRWFMPEKGGSILDPFAGGSVRGIVASKLGKDYTGIDLSKRQIQANEVQAKALCKDHRPRWIVGDSKNIKKLVKGSFDFVFSCPPYFDLEEYSDDPADLSTMDWPAFCKVYREIIGACVSMLKENRFACFVVGDIRDNKGFYRNFVSETISAFQAAGAILYNEAILVTAIGSLPIRIGRQFEGYRKLGKTHQNVLVFYKGAPKVISQELGTVEIPDLAEQYGEVA